MIKSVRQNSQQQDRIKVPSAALPKSPSPPCEATSNGSSLSNRPAKVAPSSTHIATHLAHITSACEGHDSIATKTSISTLQDTPSSTGSTTPPYSPETPCRIKRATSWPTPPTVVTVTESVSSACAKSLGPIHFVLADVHDERISTATAGETSNKTEASVVEAYTVPWTSEGSDTEFSYQEAHIKKLLKQQQVLLFSHGKRHFANILAAKSIRHERELAQKDAEADSLRLEQGDTIKDHRERRRQADAEFAKALAKKEKLIRDLEEHNKKCYDMGYAANSLELDYARDTLVKRDEQLEKKRASTREWKSKHNDVLREKEDLKLQIEAFKKPENSHIIEAYQQSLEVLLESGKRVDEALRQEKEKSEKLNNVIIATQGNIKNYVSQFNINQARIEDLCARSNRDAETIRKLSEDNEALRAKNSGYESWEQDVKPLRLATKSNVAYHIRETEKLSRWIKEAMEDHAESGDDDFDPDFFKEASLIILRLRESIEREHELIEQNSRLADDVRKLQVELAEEKSQTKKYEATLDALEMQETNARKELAWRKPIFEEHRDRFTYYKNQVIELRGEKAASWAENPDMNVAIEAQAEVARLEEGINEMIDKHEPLHHEVKTLTKEKCVETSKYRSEISIARTENVQLKQTVDRLIRRVQVHEPDFSWDNLLESEDAGRREPSPLRDPTYRPLDEAAERTVVRHLGPVESGAPPEVIKKYIPEENWVGDSRNNEMFCLDRAHLEWPEYLY
ncbi:uncharacterized protein BDZ99DRAFT_569466 [Mytilinidion resinicola]|uniref:Uncharacterized protein n=1 Tax=Mytilinidion resinicola TaxID=574789 RepID=A0A6A6YTV8_9PEZI|nr:uncharacterized protein BDZ99DRAFT_569466 [Mytilinidion resinicola]KAF2811405.1 hypothetical protein BDZ99DRAFT_569466 [Mytilinidion resinicola]